MPRTAFATTSCNDKVYICGKILIFLLLVDLIVGGQWSSKVSNLIDIFDLKTSQWLPSVEMKKPR